MPGDRGSSVGARGENAPRAQTRELDHDVPDLELVARAFRRREKGEGAPHPRRGDAGHPIRPADGA